MQRFQFRNSLDFYQHDTLDNQVDALARNAPRTVDRLDWLFCFEADASRIELEGIGPLVDHLLEPWIQLAVNRKTNPIQLVTMASCSGDSSGSCLTYIGVSFQSIVLIELIVPS